MYNYKEGKKRVDQILENNLEIIENNRLPKSDDLTFDNSYFSWVGSIFIDIRNSSKLFKSEDNIKISKLIKAFTSELIEILRSGDNIMEIGINGDCVYAIYTVPFQYHFEVLYTKACYCNTYIKMLNKLLNRNNLPTFKAGIGLGASQTLVIKAGRKNIGINDKVWIGDSVIDASNFSSIANKNGVSIIVMSKLFYNNLKDVDSTVENFFSKGNDRNYGDYYSGNVIITDFDNWINNDFPD